MHISAIGTPGRSGKHARAKAKVCRFQSLNKTRIDYSIVPSKSEINESRLEFSL